jgi:tetratricopeptide (TPR) repeat protein
VLCSKIGNECPHRVTQDNHLVFVMMPFKGFDNEYYAIQRAVEGIQGKDFKCLRADEKYTTFAIWCQKICKNIRKAKYLIVDTTGRNPNVFYELGFSHALENTKAILITKSVKDAPFDIADIDHITYSKEDLRQLEKDLRNALLNLEKEEEEEGYENKTTDEMMVELKSQLRQEEERASKFKKELYECEERERNIKEASKRFRRSRASRWKKQKTRLSNMKISLRLSNLPLDDDKRSAEAVKWFRKGYDEWEKGNYEKAIEYYTKAIELNPEYLAAYINRGTVYHDIKEYKTAIKDYDKAVEINPESAEVYSNRGYSYIRIKEYEKALRDLDRAIQLKPNHMPAYNNRGLAYAGLKVNEKAIKNYNKAIELNPEYSTAYFNRGQAYAYIKEYDTAINDYNKAIKLKPNDVSAYKDIAELYIITGNYNNSLTTIKKTFDLSLDTEDTAVCLYLECIAKKMLGMDVSDSEKKFNEILKKGFQTSWLFELIESWLEEADIDEDKKAYIIEKTEQLKKHVG